MDTLCRTIREWLPPMRAAQRQRRAVGAALCVVCRQMAALRGVRVVPCATRLPAALVTRLERVTTETIERNPAWLHEPAHYLGELYQRLRAEQRVARRATGCYYTPEPLVIEIVERTLAPLLANWTNHPDRIAALLQLRVLDPACGSGRFLIAVARRLMRQWCVWSGIASNSSQAQHVLQHIVAHCLLGRDLDPVAVELTRWSLYLETLNDPSAGTKADAFWQPLNTSIRVADSLREASLEPCDAIVGNPPFVNMIDGGLAASAKQQLTRQHRTLGGTADLAYHFVAQAHASVRSAGTIGLVLPRSFLNAPSAVRLRAQLADERPPSWIMIPQHESTFQDAATYICAIVFGGEPICHTSLIGSTRHFVWPTTADDHRQNWWRTLSVPMSGAPSASVPGGAPLGERYLVTAGMTTGEAYAIRGALREAVDGDEPRLITSRLIDPGHCRWGEVPCRYLRQQFLRPVLPRGASLPASVGRRIDQARRPKLLLAGLANRFEAYLDTTGRDLGAVSTWTIYHPHDDVASLTQLVAWLHTETAHEWLVAELGAASVGHGYMTITKRAIQQLPLEPLAHEKAA